MGEGGGGEALSLLRFHLSPVPQKRQPVPGSEMQVESRSVITNAKNPRGLGRDRAAPIFPAATAPFPRSCASYFRFARFNTFPLYYLRAWQRLQKRLILRLDLSQILKSGKRKARSNKTASNGSRGEETVNNKTQTQGNSFLFLFLSKIGIQDVFCDFIHSLINSKSNEPERTPTEFGLPVVLCTVYLNYSFR